MLSNHFSSDEEKSPELLNNDKTSENLLSPSCPPPQADHGRESSPPSVPPPEKSESNEPNPNQKLWESAKFHDIVGQNLDQTIAKNPDQKSARMLIVLAWHMFWTILFFCACFFRSGKFRHDPHFLTRTIAFACISAGVFVGIVLAFRFNKSMYQMATKMILGKEIIGDYTIVYIELWIMGPLRILGIWAPRKSHQPGENGTQSPPKATEDAQSGDISDLVQPPNQHQITSESANGPSEQPGDEEEDSNRSSHHLEHPGQELEMAGTKSEQEAGTEAQGRENSVSSPGLLLPGDRGSASVSGTSASVSPLPATSNDSSQKTTVGWTVCDWIQLVLRWLLVAICATPFLVLIVCDLKSLGDELPNGRYAKHVGYLFHEIYELVLYGAAVLAFWNAEFVKQLFLLDNASSNSSDFASVPEDEDQDDEPKQFGARSFLNCCPRNQSSATVQLDVTQPLSPRENNIEAPPVGSKTGVETSEDKKPERKMSRDVVLNSWGFTWWFMTPAALFALVAYCASVTLDTVPYRSYNKYNDWLPYFFNLTPLGGTSYFVGNGFVSGTSFIISVAVWFCCRTVTLELNRIAKELNDHHEVQKMLKCVHNVRERMDKIFNELKYIILVQTAFAIIMIGLLAIQILGRIPRVHIVIVDEDSFVSAFVSLCQSVITIAFASQIFEQWNCIYQLLMDYQRQRLTNDAYKVHVMNVVHYMERSPIGVKMFGIFIGEQSLNNMVILVVGEAFTIGCQIATNSLAK